MDYFQVTNKPLLFIDVTTSQQMDEVKTSLALFSEKGGRLVYSIRILFLLLKIQKQKN